MSKVGEREILTQQRVVEFFRDVLGYDYLGNWKNRDHNRNVENKHLTAWLEEARPQ